MKKLLLAMAVVFPMCWESAMADEGFKPNGTLGFTQTFYGNAGGYTTAASHASPSLNYNFAPKWNLNLVWDRTWGRYNYTGEPNQQYQYFSQPAGTLTYTYGQLGNSKVNWSSSLQVENQTDMVGGSSTYLYGQTVFDFSKYLPKSDFIKSTQFAIAPQYLYGWNNTGGSGHVNAAGVALLTQWQLPANFSITLNAYLLREWYNGAMTPSGPGSMTYSNLNYFLGYAWLQYQNTLFKFDQNTSLSFNFIGGLDPYMSSGSKVSGWMPFLAGNSQYEWLDPTIQAGNYSNSYILFALPQFVLTYQVNKKLSVNLFMGVKYSNQVWGNTQGAWSFMPQGGFGMTYQF